MNDDSTKLQPVYPLPILVVDAVTVAVHYRLGWRSMVKVTRQQPLETLFVEFG